MQSPQDVTRRARIDALTLIAIACLIAGWFWMSAGVTRIGRLELHFHFYDLWSVISRPSLLLTGVSSRAPAKSIAFGLVCAVVAMAPLVPYLWQGKYSRPASLAPLLLMLLCGAALYVKTSSGYFEPGAGTSALGRDLLNLANDVATRVNGTLAKRISIGPGTYLSLLASIYLAIRGWQPFGNGNNHQRDT